MSLEALAFWNQENGKIMAAGKINEPAEAFAAWKYTIQERVTVVRTDQPAKVHPAWNQANQDRMVAARMYHSSEAWICVDLQVRISLTVVDECAEAIKRACNQAKWEAMAATRLDESERAVAGLNKGHIRWVRWYVQRIIEAPVF